jgi:hypothetical protein
MAGECSQETGQRHGSGGVCLKGQQEPQPREANQGEEISGLLAGYYQANSVKKFQAVAALFA